MAETTRIADQLRRSYDGDAWHGESLSELLRGVKAEQAAAKPMHDSHSIWALVLHIAAWDEAVRKRMTGAVVNLSEGQNFPAVLETSERAWKAALQQSRETHDALVEAILKFPEAKLSEQVPGKLGTHNNFYYMLHGVVQHKIYHAGQIALLKKMWP